MKVLKKIMCICIISIFFLLGCSGPNGILKDKDKITLNTGQYIHVYLPQGVRRSITYCGMPDQKTFIVALNGHNVFYNIKSRRITLYSSRDVVFNVLNVDMNKITVEVVKIKPSRY
jgi:hypothetical protein